MEEGGENGVGRWMMRGEEERKCGEEINAFPNNCKGGVCGGFLDWRHAENDLMGK